MSFANKYVKGGHLLKGKWVKGNFVVFMFYSGVCVF